MLTRKAKIIEAKDAECCDGVYVLSVDNQAVISFEALNCEPHEFAEWYLRRYDSENAEYKSGEYFGDDSRHEIWLWVNDPDVITGQELTITSDEAFDLWLEKKIEEHDRELKRMIASALIDIKNKDISLDQDIPYVNE